MTAALGLAVYGAAVARSAFLGSAPVGIAAAVMAAVMTGEQHGAEGVVRRMSCHIALCVVTRFSQSWG